MPRRTVSDPSKKKVRAHKMHEAYTFSPCTGIHDSINIESIASLGNKLIIGTTTGKLFMYSISRNADSTITTTFYSCFDTEDKKPIRQMKCVPKKNLLFALTNGMINVFYIGGFHFALTHRCIETKGCHIFAVDVKIAKSKSGEIACTISLCVSIKRLLKFFIFKSEELEPLAKEIALEDEPVALQFMDSLICVGYSNNYVAYNIFSEISEKNELISTPQSSSSTKRACICSINNSMFGLTKDDVLLFIDSNTLTRIHEFKPEEKLMPIHWETSILDLVWDEPYLIGRTDNGLAIHVLKEFASSKNTLVQTIPGPNKIKVLVRSENSDIFVASQSNVWYLRMVDVAMQRKVLLMQKEFKLVIKLMAQSTESEKSKIDIVRKIRISYARDLVENKKFAAALQEFFEADVNPSDVIALFPSSIKGDLKVVESSIYSLNLPEFQDNDLENAIPALIKYLTATRRKEINLKSKSLTIIDTTLLRCYLQTDNALIAPLLRRKQCNFLESESILKKHNKLNELIILYNAFNEHAKALNLLKAQALKSEWSPDHERIVEYLQNLHNDHKDLIFEHSKWILDNHPEEGLRIFTNTLCEHENNRIPREEVFNFLSKASEISVLPYLEYVVYVLHDSSQFFHDALIMTYVKTIIKFNEKHNLLSNCKHQNKELEELQSYRSKLFGILENSDIYCPETILHILPVEDFLHERIQVLRRMNDHEKILVIYIQILGNVEKALEYCEQIKNSEVFEKLLQILLNPYTVSPYEGVRLHKDFLEPNLEIVLQLLNKYPTKLDLPRVFSILPDNISVHRIKVYMEIVSRINMKRSWHYSILKGTLKAELLRLNQETSLHRQKNQISLTESSTCKKCQKHFNNGQVLVRSANGNIEHLSCFKNNNS